MTTQRKIILLENHRRSLSSTLMIVEQLLIEIEDLMTSQSNTCCFEIKNDVASELIKQNLKVIEDAHRLICKLAEKYSTDMYTQSLQRIIDAKKTKMWEIICDSKAKTMKGFGEFPQELVKEYDKDLDELMSLSEKIKY